MKLLTRLVFALLPAAALAAASPPVLASVAPAPHAGSSVVTTGHNGRSVAISMRPGTHTVSETMPISAQPGFTVAQASTVSHRTAMSAAALPGHLVHLRDGRTIYLKALRLRPQSGAPRPASGARTAANTYDHGYVELCNNASCSAWTVEIVYTVTYNGNNVWVNGWPKCYQYGTQIDDCTYWDNGQPSLVLSVNFGTHYLHNFQVTVDADGYCNGEGDIGVIAKESCWA
jgi:hypothetical protein